MKTLRALACAVAIWALLSNYASAQTGSGGTGTSSGGGPQYVSAAPSVPGSCGAPSLFITTAGVVYTCQGGVYVLMASGGGGGAVGNGSQYNPCVYTAAGTSTSCSGAANYLLDVVHGTTLPAPTGTGPGLIVKGDSNSSDIFQALLAGGGKGAWIDSLGGIHGSSLDVGAGTGQGCVQHFDPTGLLYVNWCGPNANLTANYEMDLPAIPAAGLMAYDGFQAVSFVAPNPNQGNGLVSGGQVFCQATTLVCTISAAVYTIAGQLYSSAETNVTLVADGTNPRIDVFEVDNTGTANFISGTPAGSPAAPSVDPTTQLQVGFVTIATSATHATVTNETVYLENAGPAAEWTMTKSGSPINLASTNNPYAGTKDIEATAAVAGNWFQGVRGSGSVIPSSFSVLDFELRSKATWPKNKCLLIQFSLSTANVGNSVSVCNGSFAFNSSQTSSYQQIAIAASLFNAGTAVDTVRFTVTGGGASFGWYIDNIILQSGVTPPPPIGSGGTVNTGTSGQLAYYAAGGTTVSGENTWTTAQSPVAQNRRVCAIVVGSDNASSVIADADLGPQNNRCFIPYAATLVEMDVDSDAGTPNVIAQKRHCSTFTTGKCSAWTDSDFVSSALAATTGGFPSCSNTGGTTGIDGGTTCSSTLQNTSIAVGDYLQLKSGTAGGTAKRLTISLVFTVN